MATSTQSREGCSKCSEMHQSYLNALDEKRAGLLRLREEQERTKRLRRRVEKLEEKLGSRRELGGPRKSENSAEAMHTGKSAGQGVGDLQREFMMACHDSEKCLRLEKEADEAKQSLVEASTRIAALESEVTRLAALVAVLHRPENSEHADIVKEQLQVYQDDFIRERKDRERAESEKESLRQQVRSAHEVITALSHEIGLNKEIKRNREERQLQSQRRHSAPVPLPAEPQIQIVYPLVNPAHRQNWERQQERRRQGILTRGGPCPAPPSAFFGGEVEVDH